MKKHNLAFIDVETTGFNPDTQEIIQLGCVIAEQVWENGVLTLKHVDEFEYKIRPEHIETADAQALRVNGYDAGEWIFAYGLPEAMKMFDAKVKDCIFVAHNACFDFSFIDKAYRTCGIESSMHFHKLDTISMAFTRFYNDETVEKYSLRNLCERFNIKNSNAHTALADARALMELYPHLINAK